MMIGGIKATLIICLTVLVSCVLFISYNEYANRYSLIATNDNHLYIFDKKSTILNRCGEKGCELIETKLPSKVSFGLEQTLSPSKMFESDNKPMRDEIVKTEASPEKNTIPDQPSAKEPKTDEHKSDEKKTSEKSDTDKKDDKPQTSDKKTKKSSEDEFIE